MSQSRVVEQLSNTMLGRLRLRLFRSISGTDTIPADAVISQYLIDEYRRNETMGGLLHAITHVDRTDRDDYKSIQRFANSKATVRALERYPLTEPYFIELHDCPKPLPVTLGIVITCYELAHVERGFVYNVFLLGEERFPQLVIDFVQVRACEAFPSPVISVSKKGGHSVFGHDDYSASLSATIAIHVLGFREWHELNNLKRRQQNTVTSSTSLFTMSPGVHGRILRTKSGRHELAVIVDDDLSSENLRAAWSRIDLWRARLHEFQGSDLSRLDRSALLNYQQLHEHGWSYETIAMDINYDCLVNLCHTTHETIIDEIELARSTGFSGAWQLLRAVRVKAVDINNLLLEGLEIIRQGEAPWSPQTGPVSRQRVRDALRQLAREVESGQLSIVQPPTTEWTPIQSLQSSSAKQAVKMANDLLAKSFPGSYEKYENAVKKSIQKSGYVGVVHVAQ